MGSDQAWERTNEERLQLVVESIRLLAADADIQIPCFPDWVFIPDEIVQTFGDWYDMYRDRLLAAQLLTEAEDLVLQGIHHYIKRMSRHGDRFREDLWTLEAVRHDSEWQTLREMAEKALAIMNQDKRPPGDLGFGYVPAKPETDQL